jgi:hypothetical protein
MPHYRVDWLDEAKANVRTLDQPTAMRLFEGILRVARVLFTLHDDAMRIFGVRHRSHAYR